MGREREMFYGIIFLRFLLSIVCCFYALENVRSYNSKHADNKKLRANRRVPLHSLDCSGTTEKFHSFFYFRYFLFHPRRNELLDCRNVRKTLKIGIITGITNKSLNSKAQTHIPMRKMKKMKIKLNENCKNYKRVVYGLKWIQLTHNKHFEIFPSLRRVHILRGNKKKMKLTASTMCF